MMYFIMFVGILLALLGVKSILSSESDRKQYEKWKHIQGTEHDQDEYYLSFATKFVVGQLLLFVGICITCLAYYNM